MPKVVIINGSCRKGGNTDKLVSSLEQGAKEAGTGTVLHVLRKESIGQCRGCYHCYKNPRCAVKDDMQQIHDEMQSAELVILASPMYWWGFTGLMKTFIDRLYLYWHNNNAHRIAGKKLIIVVPMHVNEQQHGRNPFESEIEPLKTTSRYIFKRLGIDLVKIVFYSGLGDKASIQDHPEHVSSAYGLGQSLHSICQ